MLFETNRQGEMMATLEELTGSTVKDGLLILPETFGVGYIKHYELGPLLQMMVHQYVLAEDILGKRTAGKTGKELITFSFRHVLQEPANLDRGQIRPTVTGRLLPSVQVSSGDIDLETFTPANTKINIILITIHVDLLKDLLNKKEGNSLFQTIISGSQPYLYEELISPEIQHLAAKIIEVNVPDELRDFYLRIKAEEMIYLFLTALMKRESVASYPLNSSDVNVMYLIRDKLIGDLSSPPNLTELTLFANMSESKLNRLFKQIFGNSIYNYYQTLRINAAAFLIKEEKLSVSEAGYRLGFTNLSHFTRIFEKQIGLKPKKYSVSQ